MNKVLGIVLLPAWLALMVAGMFGVVSVAAIGLIAIPIAGWQIGHWAGELRES